jgi:hypothetical protein
MLTLSSIRDKVVRQAEHVSLPQRRTPYALKQCKTAA